MKTISNTSHQNLDITDMLTNIEKHKILTDCFLSNILILKVTPIEIEDENYENYDHILGLKRKTETFLI